MLPIGDDEGPTRGARIVTIALIAIREPGHAKARPYRNKNTRRARPVLGRPAAVHP